VPRSKYTKGPGPLLPIERIARDAFRFDDDARRELIDLLPVQLQQLRVPENIKQAVAESPGAPKLETLTELIVALTEEYIRSYLTTTRGLVGDTPLNPAKVKAAIRKLRQALKPFVAGWVDDETADIIPDDLDKQLDVRERELAGMRLPPAKRRYLAALCKSIGAVLKCYAQAEVAFPERDAIRYVATALDYAGIEHSYSTENPSRFAALVFPKS
jgi:hypothetical protein